MVLPKLHGTTNTSDKSALVAWCRQRPTRMWQEAASGWHALTPMNSRSMVGCDGSYPSTQLCPQRLGQLPWSVFCPKAVQIIAPLFVCRA